MIPLLGLVWFHINGSDLQCITLGLVDYTPHKKTKVYISFPFFSVSLQERTALSLM